MSEEPRIQFEESNTVVSEIWFDESSGETVVESQSGEQYRFDDSGTLKAPSLSTGELTNIADHIVGSVSELETWQAEHSAGSTLFVGPGDYGLSQAVKPKSDTRLILHPDATLKVADGSTADFNPITIQDVSGVTVEGGTVDGNAGNTTDPGTHIEGCGVHVDGSTDVTIRDMMIVNPHYRNLITYYSEDVRVENCRIEQPGEESLVQFDHGTVDAVLADCTIVDGSNSVVGVRVDATGEAVSNVRVENTTIERCDLGAEARGTAQAGVVFEGNTVIEPTTGLYLDKDARALWNTIRFPSTSAIVMHGTSEAVENRFVGGDNINILNINGNCELRNNTQLGGTYAPIRVVGDGTSIVGHTWRNFDGNMTAINASNCKLADCLSVLDGASTTLAAAASSGDTQITMAANPWVLGQEIEIVHSGGESPLETYVRDIIDDGTNGAGYIIELGDALPASAASGNAVNSGTFASGLDWGGDNSLLTDNIIAGGVTDSGTGNTLDNNLNTA